MRLSGSGCSSRGIRGACAAGMGNDSLALAELLFSWEGLWDTPPPPMRALVPTVHGILNSDSSRPMGTTHPPMEGLFLAHTLLDAVLELVGLVAFTRQRDPLGITSQGLEARLPLMQSGLYPPCRTQAA